MRITTRSRRTRLLALAAALTLLVTRPIAAQSASAQHGALSRASRETVIRGILGALSRQYVFPDLAAQMQRAITARRDSGIYSRITDGDSLAAALTTDLQRVSHDQHLIVRFRDGDAARRPYVPTAYDAGCSRDTGLCKDSILAGNVGYFKIRTFTGPVADVAGELALTMGRLARCDAVIIDIRRHPGGSPDVVRLVASYFFDSTPVLFTSVYWRAANRTEHFYTLPTVAGPRFGPTTPLYILISKRTVSAAEEFAYDLQSRKRAVVVGANSAGAAHPGGVEVIGDHFTVFVPRGRPINPITKTDWEGVGVRPDISVSADSAIVVALNEARGKRRR